MPGTFIQAISVVLLLVLWLPGPVIADVQSTSDDFAEESREGSNLGTPRGNWVVVPIPVSNPTLGTGLEAVLMYLHPKRPGEDEAPNATSGLGVMYTNVGSWFAGAVHQNSWDNGRYRFTGFVGQGELQLKFYGIGDAPVVDPLSYSLTATVFSSQFLVRVPTTEYWYAGLKYVYLRTEAVFDLNAVVPQLPPAEANLPLTSAGLGLLLTYDSRDDNYYPTRGQYFQSSWTHYGETWGGDRNFDRSTSFYNHYFPISADTTLALRARLETSSDATPFFFLSSLQMRGFSRDRYLDRYTLSGHAEVRHKITPRWGVVAFTEAGWYADSLATLGQNQTVWSYGAGVRWQAVANKRLNVGLDGAVSSDDRAVYVRVGEAF